MSNILNVTLSSTNPPQLNVEDHSGQNNVGQSPNPQTITWELTGSAARGNFVGMDQDPPGFSWLSTPSPQAPNGPFGAPQVGANGNSLSITDNHTSSATNGSWTYMIRVMVGNVMYTTTSSRGVTSTVNDPVIINR